MLVLAAGSGVGQAAIQIARLHGARVFATAGSDDKLETRARARRVRSDPSSPAGHRRGDHAPDEPAGRRRRHRTCRRGDLGQSVRSLARGGRLVTCGATTGPHGALDLRALFAQAAVDSRLLHGHEGASCCERRGSSSRGSSSRWSIATYPLAEAAAAQRRLEESGQFGKIVLDV